MKLPILRLVPGSATAGSPHNHAGCAGPTLGAVADYEGDALCPLVHVIELDADGSVPGLRALRAVDAAHVDHGTEAP